jgi:hypothetical protein
MERPFLQTSFHHKDKESKDESTRELTHLVDLAEYQVVSGELEQRVVVDKQQNGLRTEKQG